MQTISNIPDLEWQLANGMVSKHLIREGEFDIEVVEWLDGKKNNAFDKMFLHPIETGNYIELKRKDSKDSRSYVIKLKNLVENLHMSPYIMKERNRFCNHKSKPE